MKRFINTEHLYDDDGDEYWLSEPAKGAVSSAAADVADAASRKTFLPLGGWLLKMLQTFPAGAWTRADMDHYDAVRRKLRKAEPGSVVEIENADYAWMIDMLFDDKTAGRMIDPRISPVRGAWAFNGFDRWLGFAIQQQLEEAEAAQKAAEKASAEPAA